MEIKRQPEKKRPFLRDHIKSFRVPMSLPSSLLFFVVVGIPFFLSGFFFLVALFTKVL